MKPQQAIRILMLSPCYWLLDPPARKELVREYCRSYDRFDRRDGQRHRKQAAPA